MKKMIYILVVILLNSMVNADSNTVWIDLGQNDNISVNGLAWFEQNGHKIIRLPLTEEHNVPDAVWIRGLCPSSARIRFKTNSTSLKLKINHGTEKQYHKYNMGLIATSGIDLYVGPPGKMSFWTTSRPRSRDKEYEYVYFKDLSSEMRELTLYLPSYAQLADLKIGIDAGAKILKPTEYKIKKPMVFYGTSITQGGCASRVSNGFVCITERMLNADVVNLGFSGSGKGEPVMAEIVSQIDASVYVVDCVANMNPDVMTERYEKFVRILRKNKPQIPVLLMTKIHYAREVFAKEAKEYELQNKPVFDTYNKLKAEGDKGISLFDAGEIIKVGGDHPTVDGVHLTDCGFYMIAEKLVPTLNKILEKNIVKGM